jgi:hypothetical protein
MPFRIFGVRAEKDIVQGKKTPLATVSGKEVDMRKILEVECVLRYGYTCSFPCTVYSILKLRSVRSPAYSTTVWRRSREM